MTNTYENGSQNGKGATGNEEPPTYDLEFGDDLQEISSHEMNNEMQK